MGPQGEMHRGFTFRHPQNIHIGSRFFCNINAFIHGAGGVYIGDYVLLGPNVGIYSNNHIFSDPNVPIVEQGCEEREIRIGNDVWIGANAVILAGAQIGDGCVVCAGAVVPDRQYAPHSILGGVPARVIGTRGAKHHQDRSNKGNLRDANPPFEIDHQERIS